MKKFLAFLFIASLLSFANAKDAIPSVPNPPRLVNDFAGVFTHGQKAELEERLVAFNDSTSNVVCVVVVSDLGDYSAADFAFEIGNRWGIQNKKDQNGLVVLIKVRNETAGDVFIATGYAFEGVLPDAYVKEIITEEMVPGIGELRSGIRSICGPEAKSVMHEELISRLDEAGKLFSVLIIKTPQTIPYTTTFFELDCAYWDSARQAALDALVR